MLLFSCKGNPMRQTSQKWTLVWFVLVFKHGFPQSNCKDFLVQGFNHHFCFYTRWFIINNFFFQPLLENLITQNVMYTLSQKLCISMMFFFVIEPFVFESFWLLIKTSFPFWTFFKCETVSLIALSMGFGWLRFPVLAYACGSLWDSNPSLQDYRLDFIHQSLNGKFCLCIRLLDKKVPECSLFS